MKVILFVLISSLTSLASAYEVQGVHDSYTCTVKTGYKNYTFSCCDPWVACTEDGSGKCTVLINGITYNGETGGISEIRSRLVRVGESVPTCGNYTPVSEIGNPPEGR